LSDASPKPGKAGVSIFVRHLRQKLSGVFRHTSSWTNTPIALSCYNLMGAPNLSFVLARPNEDLRVDSFLVDFRIWDLTHQTEEIVVVNLEVCSRLEYS